MMIYIWDYSLVHIKTNKHNLIDMGHVLVPSVSVNSVFRFPYSFLCFIFTCIIHNSVIQKHYTVISKLDETRNHGCMYAGLVIVGCFFCVWFCFVLALIILFIVLKEKKKKKKTFCRVARIVAVYSSPQLH